MRLVWYWGGVGGQAENQRETCDPVFPVFEPEGLCESYLSQNQWAVSDIGYILLFGVFITHFFHLPLVHWNPASQRSLIAIPWI